MGALTKVTTYVYSREDGVRCHLNCCGPWHGEEYEHPDEPAWKPPSDWPYEWRDMDRKTPQDACRYHKAERSAINTLLSKDAVAQGRKKLPPRVIAILRELQEERRKIRRKHQVLWIGRLRNMWLEIGVKPPATATLYKLELGVIANLVETRYGREEKANPELAEALEIAHPKGGKR